MKLKSLLNWTIKVLFLRFGTKRFYSKQELYLIPYWEGDFVVVIPDNIIGKIKFLLNPLKHIYIYVDKWKFSNYKFDAEIREHDKVIDSIIDTREKKFANCFIGIYRKARYKIKSPEEDIVMFWWRERYKKAPDLHYYGILE